ncbi:hypothetical protein ELE36_00710 [Pseudolysobacter antarcticus]|uniref:Calcineurin-like phosphoesterase domain-containing protein n=1 Tax=Pseudolysobacter antarcticus TaxID=2511995 RepID=A0A411HEY3_9GAMM|nr:hypothetical protein [Pseudolysobacter antarcticus]QBB69019.1 hypothetical protein ELE36_00710 [Pseudolysobacter antarcticus]
MPAIAAGARKDGAAFYWHLGDLRAIYKVDEDYAREERFKAFSPPPSLDDYLRTAWTDFSQHQVQPFANTPFFIGIGNHETIAPKTRTQFLIEFQSLLDRPELKQQRSNDAALYGLLKQTPAPRTYYHWIERGIDFINLDNASDDTFDTVQMAWFNAIVDADMQNPAITTLVVGMHESLPYSKSDSHSMCGSISGRESGTRTYAKLVEAEKKSKHVYLLASHSHYYLANIYDTDHWRDADHGGVVLPGWVVGTAGAERYPLPPDVIAGPDAREHVYGYLIGTVTRGGEVRFEFRELAEPAIQLTRGADYSADTVSFCVAQNPDPEKLHAKHAQPSSCEAATQR